MNQISGYPSGGRQANERINEVRVDYDQVFRWLNTLESLRSSDHLDFDLEQLRADLDDACWLADWKREYVLLDESKIPLAELNEMLSAKGK